VIDQGAKLASAVASIVDSKDPEEIQTILAGLPDFTSFAYRYGMPSSLLQRSYRP
jgi:F420-non-reducing hydrogenase small subunit